MKAGPIRLQRLLAAAGLASRRGAEEWIRDGRVQVNGRVATLGESADLGVDRVEVDGESIRPERPVYWMLHKPLGVLSTVRDPDARRTVMELLPASVGRVFPVGRLDSETEGLLLLTNDGSIAHVLLHPSWGSEREYQVEVAGALDARALRRLERGIRLDDGPTGPAKVSRLHVDEKAGQTRMHLTLTQGRKRQIRRTLAALGHPVRRLVRVRMGPLKLGRLARGEARPLRREELRALRTHVAELRERLSRGRSRAGAAARRPTRGRGGGRARGREK